VQILDLTRAGSSISFTIYADDKKIGEIKLGQAGQNGKWKMESGE
jgi:hypothetical protein